MSPATFKNQMQILSRDFTFILGSAIASSEQISAYIYILLLVLFLFLIEPEPV